MPVPVHYFTDPACPVSWASEPSVRRMTVEFGDSLEWRFVMGGLARDYAGREEELLAGWLVEAGRTEMPMDPLLWKEAAISSSYPACMGVVAAGDQGPAAQARYLRTLREGLMCFRRKLDSLEPLVEEARRAGLDVERFRIDAGSMATVERFGADLERTREAGAQLPSWRFGDEAWVRGAAGYEEMAAAALAAGAEAVGSWQLAVGQAFERFERLAVAEVVALCGLPAPRAHAELWQMVTDWKLRPLRSATGWLFERA